MDKKIIDESQKFQKDLEQWKKVITLGGSIDPWTMITAAIRVSSVILIEAPKLYNRIEELERHLKAAEHALRSYQYGNASIELAKGITNHIEARLNDRTYSWPYASWRPTRS